MHILGAAMFMHIFDAGIFTQTVDALSWHDVEGLQTIDEQIITIRIIKKCMNQSADHFERNSGIHNINCREARAHDRSLKMESISKSEFIQHI